LSERRTKHVFRVNLAKLRSAEPAIFHTQRKTQTDGVKNRTFRNSLRAVTVKQKQAKKEKNNVTKYKIYLATYQF